MSPNEINKIFQANHDLIMEKLKLLHHVSEDSSIIADIADLMRQNKTLFDNIADDREYCLKTVKQFTGEFKAVGGDNDNDS